MAAKLQPDADGQRQRLDKWLFFARVVKSRALAAKLVAAGHVRVNRDKTDQPAKPVRPGDVLTIALEHKVLVWRVLGTGTRRGPALEARTLYEDLTMAASDSDSGPDLAPNPTIDS